MASPRSKVEQQQQNGGIFLPATFAALTIVGYAGFNQYRRVLKRRKEKSPFGELPTPPDPHWLKGHQNHNQGDFRISWERWLQDYTNQHGQVGIYNYSSPAVVVTNDEDARLVLRNETHRRPVYAIEKHFKNFFGTRSLVLLNGREWKVHRSAVLRSFNPATVDAARKTVADATNMAVESIRNCIGKSSSSQPGEQGFSFKVDKIAKKITMDIFGRVAFSQDNLSGTPIAHAFDFLGYDMQRRLKSPFRPDNFFYWLPTPNNIRHRKEWSLLMSFLKDEIQERKNLSTNNGERPDLLSELLSTVDDNEDPLIDKTIPDILLTCLFAGYDTASTAISYALFLLSQNPSVEETLVKEIASTKTLDDQDKLPYCKAVMYETLRLYPPAPITRRYLKKPLKLSGGLVVPENTTLMIHIWLIHHNSRHYPDPEEFRPDRWVKQLEEEDGRWVDREEDDNSGTIAAANRGAFLAFSGGARSCPGQNFAIQETILVLANLVKSLRFIAMEGYQLTPTRRGVVQGPNDGLPMIVQER